MAVDYATKQKPYELFDKAKRQATWDPADIDFETDRQHWTEGFLEARGEEIMGTFIAFNEGEESRGRWCPFSRW